MKGFTASPRRIAGRAAGRVRNRLARVHPNPVLVLGNQKSGTSAVAGLLAAAVGLEATIDIKGIHGEEQKRLHDGSLSFPDFVRANRRDFSRPIIKEPALTFLFDELRAMFPESPFAFVVRDPRQNIRSILNRLGLPGDREELTPEQLEAAGRAGPNWRRMLEGWLGAEGENYVERLASRWNVAVDVYLAHRDRFELIRYEDFVSDKEGAIAGLARRLGLEPRRELGELVDHPFQPPGSRCVSASEFFGTANLARVVGRCRVRMRELGYGPDAG